MGKIALLVDGNNVIHRYWESPLVAPVLDLSLCYLEHEGEVSEKVFYLDQRNKHMEGIALGPPFAFWPGTGEGYADFKIKKKVESLVYNADIESICIASGDSDLASHHAIAQKEGKSTIAIALEHKMSAEIVEAADRSLILPIDIIESFSKDMRRYIGYRDSVMRGERTIDNQREETLKLLNSGYRIVSGDSDEG